MPATQAHSRWKPLVWRFAFILLLVLLITRCVDFSLIELVFRSNERIPFNVNGWHGPMVDTDGIFTGTRLKMFDDLLDQYDFHGWTVEEVEELLGESERKKNEDGEDLVRYDLRDRLKWLIFQVDEEERIVDYWVYID